MPAYPSYTVFKNNFMTEFGYNEPNKGSLKNIPLNILILFGLFLILTFGVVAIAWEWLKGE